MRAATARNGQRRARLRVGGAVDLLGVVTHLSPPAWSRRRPARPRAASARSSIEGVGASSTRSRRRRVSPTIRPPRGQPRSRTSTSRPTWRPRVWARPPNAVGEPEHTLTTGWLGHRPARPRATMASATQPRGERSRMVVGSPTSTTGRTAGPRRCGRRRRLRPGRPPGRGPSPGPTNPWTGLVGRHAVAHHVEHAGHQGRGATRLPAEDGLGPGQLGPAVGAARRGRVAFGHEDVRRPPGGPYSAAEPRWTSRQPPASGEGAQPVGQRVVGRPASTPGRRRCARRR